MENRQKLLSICIPTYNRGKLIQLCLERLCPIAQKYGIEIFVSDNASHDDTESIVRVLQRKYENVIHYKKQDINIGPDKNFEYVLNMGNSTYRWLFSDTSYIEEYDLQLLLGDLQSMEWDLYVINDGKKKRLTAHNPEIYSDPEQLLKDVGWHLTWISALIYHEKVIKNANFVRYYNSRFIQTGIIFEYFINHSCLTKINPDISVNVIDLPKNGNWINIAFEVFAKDWILFVMSLPVYYSYEAKSTCIKKHGTLSGLFTFRGLLGLRKQNFLNYRIYFKYRLFNKYAIQINTYIIFIISIMPRSLVCLGKKISKMLI